ncbi:vWA domain-containing protein [Profundibacter sp.]
MSRIVLGFIIILAHVTLNATIAGAQDTPLVMEGKKQLFQRVLVRDRTLARSEPNGVEGSEVLPLRALFVYARKDDWVQVGLNDTGGELFWLPENTVVDWKQNIVATFDGSSEVGRVLFFNDLDSLYDVVESEDPSIVARDLRIEAEKAESGGAPSETIIALGPRQTIDQRQNLYVMPILDSEEAILENGANINLLKVAVARIDRQDPAPKINTPHAAPDSFRKGYKAGVVFVVDTTISMEPYIRGTRDALETILRQVEGSAASDAISFGLIGYRDNLSVAPGLEYDVKTFVNLTEGSSSAAFLSGIAQMSEADTTSRNFREDSFKGVEYAISAMNWEGFDARFIVLVTDAGPRVAGDPLSATGLNAVGLNSIVKESLGAAIAVMHLRTNRGRKDHESAELAYRALTRQANQSALYFPVQNGDPEKYRDGAQRLAGLIVNQVVAFRGGEKHQDFAEDQPNNDPLENAIGAAGRTMQLAFLGRTQGIAAPDVFEAYIGDRDFKRTGLKPLSIRLLLNKAQLSDLTEALSIIAERGEASVINPNEFFAQVLGAAADMSRRPSNVAGRADATIADAVAIPEYLEGLPYKSRIMNITESDYVRLTISEQQGLMNELFEKIERYKRYNQATDQWVDYLQTGGSAQSLLYPMKLDDLP